MNPVKAVLVILCILIIPGSFVGIYEGLVVLKDSKELLYPGILGFLFGAALYHWVLKRNDAIMTFEHEFTHAIVALCFLNKIHRFTVTRYSGGFVSYSGGRGGVFADFVIGLAPYFLPTFTLLFILFRPLVPASWFPWYDLSVGISFGYHVLSNFDEIKRNWTKTSFQQANSSNWTLSDIGKVGYVFAFFFILGFGSFIHGLLLWTYLAKGTGAMYFLKLNYAYFLATVGFIISSTQEIIKTVRAKYLKQ